MSNPFDPAGAGDLLPGQREPDQNDRLIPMINIVFLLLTFFMIAGTFRAAELFDVEPPEAPAGSALADDGPVVLIGRDGDMALADERLAMDAVVTRLKNMGAQNLQVRLKADRAARTGTVLPLLKRLSDAGITHVQLIAVRRK